jgi:hypothetical protein
MGRGNRPIRVPDITAGRLDELRGGPGTGRSVGFHAVHQLGDEPTGKAAGAWGIRGAALSKPPRQVQTKFRWRL